MPWMGKLRECKSQLSPVDQLFYSIAIGNKNFQGELQEEEEEERSLQKFNKFTVSSLSLSSADFCRWMTYLLEATNGNTVRDSDFALYKAFWGVPPSLEVAAADSANLIHFQRFSRNIDDGDEGKWFDRSQILRSLADWLVFDGVDSKQLNYWTGHHFCTLSMGTVFCTTWYGCWWPMQHNSSGLICHLKLITKLYHNSKFTNSVTVAAVGEKCWRRTMKVLPLPQLRSEVGLQLYSCRM